MNTVWKSTLRKNERAIGTYDGSYFRGRAIYGAAEQVATMRDNSEARRGTRTAIAQCVNKTNEIHAWIWHKNTSASKRKKKTAIGDCNSCNSQEQQEPTAPKIPVSHATHWRAVTFLLHCSDSLG